MIRRPLILGFAFGVFAVLLAPPPAEAQASLGLKAGVPDLSETVIEVEDESPVGFFCRWTPWCDPEGELNSPGQREISAYVVQP